MPRLVSSLALVFTLVPSFAGAAPRTRNEIDERDRVTLHGTLRPEARTENEIGSAPLDLPMEHILVALSLTPAAKAGLDALLSAQQDPSSPEYRRWLTPDEFGGRFGRSDAELSRLAAWMQGHGLDVEVARGRLSLDVSGRAGDVERAFGTRIAEYVVNGRLHHANATVASIPRAFEGLVAGVVSLHDFPRTRDAHRVESEPTIDPQFNSGGRHYLAPGDVAKIYDAAPVYASGVTGAGRTIAVVGRTDIAIADVQYFRSLFGLPANDPVILHNGADPGNLGGG